MTASTEEVYQQVANIEFQWRFIVIPVKLRGKVVTYKKYISIVLLQHPDISGPFY